MPRSSASQRCQRREACADFDEMSSSNSWCRALLRPGVRLALGELIRLPRGWLLRHHLFHRTVTGRYDLGVGGWGLVMIASQPHVQQLCAYRVAAIAETMGDLRGTLSCGPKFFQQCYLFRIPIHGRYVYADCRLPASRSSLRCAANRAAIVSKSLEMGKDGKRPRGGMYE